MNSHQNLGNGVYDLQGRDSSPIELGGIPETASLQPLIFKIITTATPKAFVLGFQLLESQCSPDYGCPQRLREGKRLAGEKEPVWATLAPVLSSSFLPFFVS